MDGTAPADLYERDFYAWTQDQAARLRALGARKDGLDPANLAEEVESLGKSDRRAARSLLHQLLLHLLKLRLHPAQENRSRWRAEVREFRRQLRDILDDSPSLRAQRVDLATPQWESAARAFLDGLEADGQDSRVASGLLRDGGHPYFDLDAEVLVEDWFPPQPAA